jgi:hypothetical protein
VVWPSVLCSILEKTQLPSPLDPAEGNMTKGDKPFFQSFGQRDLFYIEFLCKW